MKKYCKKMSLILAVIMGLAPVTSYAKGLGVCTHMNVDTYSNSANIKAASKAKMKWIRDEISWSTVEPVKGGEKKISEKRMDYVKKADEEGINQLLILDFGNTAYGVASEVTFPKQENTDYYNGYLDYVRFTVNEVKDYVDAYEIWNEPNIEWFNNNLEADGTDYAKLYLDAKAIINDIDPTADVLCGSVTGAGESDLSFGEDILKYIASQGDVNELVDVFSIHMYTNDAEKTYINNINAWENLFDEYGFDGDVWMTENGVATNTGNNTEEGQASYVTRVAVQWERYLMENNRTGVNFWYDLRDDGVDESDYEHRLGLVNFAYKPKPSFYAAKNYNKLTDDKTMTAYQTPKTYDGWANDKYGYLAEYSNENDKVYILYDMNGRSDTTITVPLSGDVARIYDYLGNLTETIENPSGEKTISVNEYPVYVECASYVSTISDISYNTDKNVMNVSGKFGFGDDVTIELLDENKDVVQTENFAVYDGYYDARFSVDASGEFTVRVAKPELEVLGATEGWAEDSIKVKRLADVNTQISAGTVVSFDAESKKVVVSGSVTDYIEEPNVTILVVPQGAELENLNPDSVGYVTQSKAENGLFGFEFTLPKWYEGEADIYLSGTGIDNKQDNDLSLGANKYAYVGSLDLNTQVNITATAQVKNFGENDKTFYMIVAEYKDGMLVDMKMEPKNVAGKTYTTIQTTITDDTISDESTHARAFVWNDVVGLVPLTGCMEEPIN